MSILRTVLLSTSLVALSACSTIQYYSQSIGGHLEVWWPQKPIKEVLDDPSQPENIKQQLALALKARHFASKELGLPDNDSYTAYTDLKRSHVVWNVVAAEEFSLKAKTWCYLIVGCLSYRGYFDKSDAQKHGDQLQTQGYDVSVGGVSAYSTLGWFDDPVLNTMIHWPERALVGLIFHELSHQVVYIPNETAFNEAFASAVSQLGMIQWQRTNNPKNINAYLDFIEQNAQFRQLLLDTRQRLQNLYASDIDHQQMRQLKQDIFQDLRQRYSTSKSHWPFPNAFDAWFERPLNNARLVASMTYLEKIPAFYALFKQVNGDWQTFYGEIRKMEKLTPNQREYKIEELLKQKITLQQIAAAK